MDAKPLFIADGHHRYETACNYRDWLAEQGPLDANHPANFVLTQCVSMNDPGLLVLPTHRLFRGLQADEAPSCCKRSSATAFTTRTDRPRRRPGAVASGKTWKSPASKARLAFYTAEDDTWTLAAITPHGASPHGRARRASTAPIGKASASRSCIAW